jgi:MFS family permease
VTTIEKNDQGAIARERDGRFETTMRNPFAALSAPAARDLWLAGVGINIVRWLELLAFAILALQLTGSPLWVAVMTFARMLPLLTGAFLTALVARWSKRSVLLCFIASLIVTNAVLWLLASLGRLELWHLIAAAVVGGFAWTVETPIRRTALAEAAGLERVQASMGLEVVSNQATRMLGPALGGLLLDTIGVIGVFALGTLVHALAFWLIFRQGPFEAVLSLVAGNIRQSMADGFGYMRRHRLLAGTAMVTLVFNFWGFPYVTLAPVIGETVLGLSATGIGLVVAADATGAFLAAFVIIERARPEGFARLYSFGALVFILGTFGFGFATTPLFAAIVLFTAGLGMAGFNAMQISLPIAATPPEMRVRVMGIITVAIGAAPFGFLHAGLMAEWLGAATAQKLIAGEGLVALLLVFRLWPELLRREAPRPLAE